MLKHRSTCHWLKTRQRKTRASSSPLASQKVRGEDQFLIFAPNFYPVFFAGFSEPGYRVVRVHGNRVECFGKLALPQLATLGVFLALLQNIVFHGGNIRVLVKCERKASIFLSKNPVMST